MRERSVGIFAALAGAAAVACAGAAFSCSPSHDGGSPAADASTDAPTEAALPPLEAPPEAIPPAKRRDATSSPVVFDAERGGVWTANGEVGTVSYVDVDARRVVAEIAVGQQITSVALSPDARWIAAVDRAGGRVALVEAEGKTVARTLDVGPHPRAAVWDASDPRWLYVSLEDDGAVAVIDRSEGRLVRKVTVGRLPAGLAVSATRRELAIVHRIDARVTILPLDGVYSPADQKQPLVVIALADEPANPDPKVPQGRPFAFESLAWSPDGAKAWVPHQLLASRQPLQFQSTVFPAVSVVDVEGRAEVPNDPATAPDGFDGRKVLFGGINVLDETSNTAVVSQPCAARIHPRGLVAYAVACGSEDLVVFDVITGKSVDLLRDLPGDHPSGLALDDTGARAFVYADQSQTLAVIDLAGGNPLEHVRVLGQGFPVVAKDTLDPELREGLRLFYRASSRKGTIAATGNNWMSCGACHLDGFVSTNQVFFETLVVRSQADDAQIGHQGLKDLFSTAPTPTDPSFDPHDVLVAFADQGGLAPDRTGARRDGAIDPSKPTAEAAQMAARVARVIARDLPLGPSWLLPGTTKPDLERDGAWCGACHQTEYDAWSKSAHAHAGEDPMVRFGLTVEKKARGPQYGRLCAGCHEPTGARASDFSLSSGRGITCLGCHETERLIRAGGNADSEVRGYDWTVNHKARASAGLETLRQPEFCGGCHQQFVPSAGIAAITTLDEWQHSAYAGSPGGAPPQRCVDCHAARTPGMTANVNMPIADHAMIGGNVWLATKFGDADFIARTKKKLASAVSLVASRGNGVVVVTVENLGAGHGFPTGVTDIREPWVEIEAKDAQGNVLARYGGVGADGLLPSTAARFGIDIAKPDGTLLLQHELSDTTRIPFDRRVPAQGIVAVLITVPTTLPSGTAQLDAVLKYRNLRTPYFRAATGDPTGAAPDVEVARVVAR